MSDLPAQPVQLAFPVYLRMRRKRDFERALRDGVRLTDACLTVWAADNGLTHPRLGLIVSRKHGPAVRRNRLKRLIREAFRLTRPQLPAGVDLVCTPRGGADITLADCVESLPRLAERLAARLARRRP